MNAKKFFKKVITVMLSVIVVSTMTMLPASAAYSYYNSYSFSTGALWWKQNYTAKVYRDPNWFHVYYGNANVSTGFEYKNNTNIVLSQTKNFSIGTQTKASLNAGVDFSSYGVPANVGGSIEKTTSASWGVSNTASRTIEASAPKGYYSYNVCLNTYKIKVTKYQNGTNKGTIQFFAPRSQPYRSIVYNRNNASYSGVTRY